MERVNFSFCGILDMCSLHYRDIMERKDVKKFLLNRKVRFINPWGEFDYAYFGDFYFKGNVMMLITKDSDYTPYHKICKVFRPPCVLGQDVVYCRCCLGEEGCP